MLQQRLVNLCHLLARRAVDEHAVEAVHFYNGVAQLALVALVGVCEQFAIVGEVDAVAVEECLLRGGYAHHVQLQTLCALQLLILIVNLFEQLSAHCAHAADKEVEHLVFRQEERVVNGVERLAQMFALNDERDVGLRRTLRTRYHADAGSAECAEELAGDARRVLHVLAYDGDGSQSVLGVHGVHGARLYLLRKLAVEHLYSLRSVLVAHADRRRVL